MSQTDWTKWKVTTRNADGTWNVEPVDHPQVADGEQRAGSAKAANFTPDPGNDPEMDRARRAKLI